VISQGIRNSPNPSWFGLLPFFGLIPADQPQVTPPRGHTLLHFHYNWDRQVANFWAGNGHRGPAKEWMSVRIR